MMSDDFIKDFVDAFNSIGATAKNSETGNIMNKEELLTYLKNEKGAGKEKLPVTFTYQGQLEFSIKGECTLEMTAEELDCFKKINQQAKDEGEEDILAYLEENLPESLYSDIVCEIDSMVRYNDAKECIEHRMYDCFYKMTPELFDLLTEEELIERFLEDNQDGLYEYLIESIEIR